MLVCKRTCLCVAFVLWIVCVQTQTPPPFTLFVCVHGQERGEEMKREKRIRPPPTVANVWKRRREFVEAEEPLEEKKGEKIEFAKNEMKIYLDCCLTK